MKTVLIDHSTLGRFCGFTEISENFGRVLSGMNVPDIHFIYLVPKAFVGYFGDNVSYIAMEDYRRGLRSLKEPVDLWHSTQQFFKHRHFDKRTIQLLTIHDLNFLYEKKNIHRLRHIIQLQLRIRRSDFITVISNYVENQLREFVKLDDNRVEVIYNGVRTLEKEPQKRPEFVKEGEDFLFTVGQVRWRKNFQALVPMMKYFPETKLFICGDDRARFSGLLRSLIINEDADNVVLTGAVTQEEKNWMYAHCKGFLMPSMLEGFGLPVLEAMRFGKPVFSSTLSSLPEVCGPNAFYWRDFDPESMASTVRKGLSVFNSDSARADDEIAYAKTFDYTEFTLNYLALYRRLLSL